MPQTRSPRTRSSPSHDNARAERLDALDGSLLGVRRVFQRPGYRRRLLERVAGDVELATLRLLRAVQRAEDPPSVRAVAETLTIDPSTASRVVGRAVASGHLERRTCSDDRRRARLHLTASGRRLLDRVTARRRELLAEVTDAWGAEELDQMIELLSRLQIGFDRLEDSA